MKKISSHFKFHFGILFFLLFSQLSFAQLPSFSLGLTATNETCENNGSLSFVATGTTPGASILYSIYLYLIQLQPLLLLAAILIMVCRLEPIVSLQPSL